MKYRLLQVPCSGRRPVRACLPAFCIAILLVPGLRALSGPAPYSRNTGPSRDVSAASKADATVHLTRSAQFIVVGSPVTFTATVTGMIGAVPTGNVKFTCGASNLGTVPLDSSGVAALTFSRFGIGGHGIIATYEGDSNYKPAVSAVLDILDDGVLAPTLALTASATQVKKSTSLVLAVKVTGGGPQPTGEVYFYDSATPDDTIAAKLSGDGVATYKRETATAGAYTITVVYSGDDHYQSESSTVVVVTVTAP